MHQRAETSRHGALAQLLIAWSPLSVILVAYAVAHWLNAPIGIGDGASTNRLGFPLHVVAPAEADRRVWGSIPTVWLQRQRVEETAQWYDAAAALVYVTHFVAIPLVTAIVWFLLRDRFTAWIASVLTFTTLGVGGYVVYPAAPPWLASDMGEIGDVSRISGLGWDYLHLEVVGRLIVLGQEGSNPVAAMPSLHAGSALLVALFLWPSVNPLWRAALVGYAVAMAVTLVYTGEHYVVDVVVGWLVAAIGTVVGAAMPRRRIQTRAPTTPPVNWPEPLSRTRP